MKRSLLYILILILSAIGARAVPPPGYVLVSPGLPISTVPSSGTYGGVFVKAFPTTTSFLHVTPPVANPGCPDILPDPGTDRVGGGVGFTSGDIEFTFATKPVYGVYIMISTLNAGEIVRIRKNSLPYPLSVSECTFTDCYSSTGAGPTFINTAGEMEGPACCGLSSPYNGGTITMFDCSGIQNIDVFCNGFVGGINMALYIDTVKPPGCSNAFANSPCEPDSLFLQDIGDSSAATYFWTGPLGFTSTLQDPVIPVTTAAMSGVYRAYKIQTVTPPFPLLPYVVHDTDTVNVVIHPRAYVNSIGNNGPICENPDDTLHLFATTPGTYHEKYSWTGPNLFADTVLDPNIYGFVAADSGTYKLVTTNEWGCMDSATTYVVLRPNPAPPTILGPSPYCFGDPFVPFTTTGVTGGGTVLWYPTRSGGVSSTVPPTINTSAAGTYTVYASQVEALYCESVRDSIVIVVKPQIKPIFTWTTLLGCDADAVTFDNSQSVGADWFAWDFGDGTFSADTTTKPTIQHEYLSHQVHKAILHGYTPGCEVRAPGYVNTTHSVTALFKPVLDTFCAGGNTFYTNSADSFLLVTDSSVIVTPDGAIGHLTGTSLVVDTGKFVTNIATPAYLGANYAWDFGDGKFDTTNTRTPPGHNYDSGGVYTVKLTVTDSIGCKNTVAHDVYVIKLFLGSFHDTMLCLSQPLLLNIKSLPTPLLADQPYSYSWTPASYLSDSTVLTPYYNSGTLPDVTTTYSLTQTQTTYGCFTVDTIRIHAVKGVKLANVTLDQTIPYGNSIQLNADSEAIYFWKNNNGTLNNANINDPVATPLESTAYQVYGYDRNGCLDSAYVMVTVDSSMLEAVPSAFTPNFDGLNDVFRPVGIKFQNLVDFRVYNRLGQQVFYSNSYKNGWDGTFNGQPQDLGVYSYVIIVAKPGGEGENIMYKGTVTLIR